MTHAVKLTFLSAAMMLLSVGCCGPMWQPGGCGSACGTTACGTCDDGCGNCGGCGELYIDPWINHPPDCCDPCDCCGNYNGQSCGKCRGVFAGVKSLWGYKCVDDGGGCDGGCDSGSCGHGTTHGGYHDGYQEGEIHSYGEYSDGEIISEEVVGSGSNSPRLAQPRMAVQPGHKPIFQPRRVNGPKQPLAY
ncbi:hypothetical protein [Neorhodopirellula pilleata]|uniref:Uncharacterized protein n=1 Tax=Neorhodopirellula pilleata TaxID=2714738 RepID=A0A5C5ZIU7_9BACT|nr:hypothetical protein [Neorhodopirellula pilleata]TWT86463.1 hypothetical protein Pla100_60340 [Neorhodopirellula pilleata]